MSLSVKVARYSGEVGAMPGVGDPGLFGSIGGLIGKVSGIASKIPGPIGWAGSAVSSLSRRTPARQAPRSTRSTRSGSGSRYRPSTPSVKTPIRFAPPAQVPRPGIVGTMQRFIPGGESGYIDASQAPPAGHHLNKTDYFLKDGTFVPAGSRWVKNRRRNPLNPRAASKAVGRIEALKRATSRFSNITVRKKCKC